MDIDIDFKPDFDPLEYFPQAVRASMVKDGEIKKHPAGAYLQNIAKDKITDLSAIPYEQAEDLGYFKVDFLHITLLEPFENKKEIRALLKIEPDWTLLEEQETVEKLFQIHRHFDIVYRIKPKSIDELADCIALIRPGKRHLLEQYTDPSMRVMVREEIYRKPEDSEKYYFKRAHAIAYAMNIVLQLHLIKAEIL